MIDWHVITGKCNQSVDVRCQKLSLSLLLVCLFYFDSERLQRKWFPPEKNQMAESLVLDPPTCVSGSKGNPIGTAHHWTGCSSAAHLSWQLPCCEPSGILGASVGAQSPSCGPERQCPLRLCPLIQRLQGHFSTSLTASQQPFQDSFTLCPAPSA
jgi:hypothetical protein